MGRVVAFVTNRGGAGKSSLCSQVAASVARDKPTQQVLVLDFSIQGDTSTILLGGTGEPDADQVGARTRGGGRVASLPLSQTAAGFITAAREAHAATAAAEAEAASLVGRLGSARLRLWGGSAGKVAASESAATAPPLFSWREHAVQPSLMHPSGRAPSNLYISAGGGRLHKLLPDAASSADAASALRLVFSKFLSSDVLVLIDTDAELSERGCSSAGIASASELCLVLSSSWTDYNRVLDDSANGLFAAMSGLEASDPAFKARIQLIVFNNVAKRTSTPSELCGSPSALPFTPPAPAKAAIADILSHLLSMTRGEPGASSNLRRFFAGGDENAEDSTEEAPQFASLAAFTARYAAGMATVADSLWQHCLAAGVPVSSATATEPQAATAEQLATIAKRLFIG